MRKDKLLHGFIITTFVSLYLIVSVISTIHVIDFFSLSNPQWLSISLAIAFEIGAAASLASLIVLDKMSKSLVWGLFIILTCMQMMGNTYYAFTNLQDYQSWVELFGLVDEDPLYQKRVLSIISGAILPLVALGFIKSLVDYIRPAIEDDVNIHEQLHKPTLELNVDNKLTAVNTVNKETQSLGKLAYQLKETPELPFIEDTLKIDSQRDLLEKEVEPVAHLEDANNFATVYQEVAKDAKKLPTTIAPVNQEEILKEFEESSEIDNINGSEKKSLT